MFSNREVDVRKLAIATAACGMMVSCATKPASAPVAAAKPDSANPVIVHIVSQDHTVTISSSPQGLLYSLKDADGRVMIADATSEEFAELRPELYRNIRHYIAVKSDDSPIPSAAVTTPIPTARHYDE